MKIEVNEFSKMIKGVKVLDNISISFESGNIYGLIGKNGSGKTMFLRMISGLILPNTGQVKINGEILGKKKSFPENLGILLEKPNFLPYLTGYQNLKILARIKDVIEDKDIQAFMTLFDLDWKSKKKFKTYSLGMKQKLGIIQAIMEDQQFVILDEPFNALDEQSIKTLRNTLKKMKEKKKLIIMTSHNKEDINLLCDHTFEISEGKIIDFK